MKKYIFFFSLLFCLAGTVGCSSKEVNENRIFQVNYINNAETKVIPREYVMESDLEDTQAQISELLAALGKIPEKLEYRAPLGQGFSVLDFSFFEGNLILNMDEKYSELSVPQEVLTRVALVRTLVQVKGVEYVGISVMGKPVLDSLGSPVGMMNEDTFLENEGSQINAMEKTRIKLYFSDREGKHLVPVNRTLVYNTNIPIEKVVMEQLIAGPSTKKFDVCPTLNPDTEILGMTINDGICYLNLSGTFLKNIYDVSAEVVIYSIVNSLIELPTVNKVQIAVDGKTEIMYREQFNLETVYERNWDLLVSPE